MEYKKLNKIDRTKNKYIDTLYFVTGILYGKNKQRVRNLTEQLSRRIRHSIPEMKFYAIHIDI